MNPIEVIREKAQKHKQKYKKFNLERFMQWVEEQSLSWQLWASEESIPHLTKMNRFDRYSRFQNIKDRQYTPEYGDN